MAILGNGDLASGSYKEILIWNSTTGDFKLKLTGHFEYIISLAVLKNGYLISGSKDYSIKIWDTKSVLLKQTLTGHFGDVVSIVVLPNDHLASASDDKTIKIWKIFV